MRKKIELNLDDLRVESFEVLPELADEQAMLAVGGAAAPSSDTGCSSLCGTGCETVVCCYPTQGNGSDVAAPHEPAPAPTAPPRG